MREVTGAPAGTNFGEENPMDFNTPVLKHIEHIHETLKQIKNGFNPQLEEESKSKPEPEPIPEHDSPCLARQFL